LHAFEYTRDASARQFVGHFSGTTIASLTQLRQARLQRRMFWIDVQANHMNGLCLPGGGNFHTRNKANAVRIRRLLRFGNAIQHIMIGQRQHLDPGGSGTRNHLGWRQHTIGIKRMAM
jgi:hypothetical protein